MRRRGVSGGVLDPLADPEVEQEWQPGPGSSGPGLGSGGAGVGSGGPVGGPGGFGGSGAPSRRTLQTEFTFELPRGYVDESGAVHRDGAMRLATARDELAPLADLRVKQNPAYLSVVLLSLVITRIGAVTPVRPEVIERLFASDLAFLQDFYRRINTEGHTRAEVECPGCALVFEVDVAGGRPGES